MEQLPVFVYGTLRRGMGNHGVIGSALAAVHEARLPGHCLYSDGLPYVAECGDPEQAVTGELLIIRDSAYEAAMERLDWLEGFRPPHHMLYVRGACRALVQDEPGAPGRETKAWVYHGGSRFSYAGRLLVPGGDWAAARAA
jgi:gamma-glutamylcyclotransferase (GGCT)/AIG2-like uncharacterized protein YtfP